MGDRRRGDHPRGLESDRVDARVRPTAAGHFLQHVEEVHFLVVDDIGARAITLDVTSESSVAIVGVRPQALSHAGFCR